MEVASICSGNGIASSLRGAMLSAQSGDFGMLDTSSYALALVGDKEHQARRQFSRSSAFSSRRNQDPNSAHRDSIKRICVVVHFSAAVSSRCTAKQCNSEPNKRIKVIRFAHSTAQELRTCAALYARRSASRQ